jgi:hypothetical protein
MDAGGGNELPPSARLFHGLIQVPTRTMRDGDHHRLTGEGT